MDYFVLTDPHLGHYKLETLGVRPRGFTELVLENLWEMLADSGNVLICLGDINMGNDEYWHSQLMTRLRGTHKWLVKGNHDKKSDAWYLSHGWNFVSDRLYLERYGLKMLFTHKPVGHNWTFDLNLHGHFHNNPVENWEDDLRYKMSNRNYLFVLEDSDYKPTLLNDKFINKIRKERGI